MAKRRGKPYHLRYHGDALGGYETLTLEERGAYTTLLDQMYDHGGPIRDDVRNACAWLNCDIRVWKRLRASLVDHHRKLHAYTDAQGRSWLVNDRVQAELKLPTYDELAANLGDKLPIAAADLSPNSPEKPRENNDRTQTEMPKNAPLIPLPIPDTPIVPTGDGDAKPEGVAVRKADVDAVWEITPRIGRERSSRKDVERALVAAARRGKAPDRVRAGLVGYYASDQATKDGGQFAKGCHRMIENDRWEEFAPDDEPPPLVAAAARPSVEITWARRLAEYGKNQFWNRLDWGPPPGRPDCRAPADLLEALGFTSNRSVA